MNTLPISLFSREQLNRHASIGGYVVVDHDGRATICELQGWGQRARVQFPSRNIRSLPLHAVTGIIDPVYTTAVDVK